MDDSTREAQLVAANVKKELESVALELGHLVLAQLNVAGTATLVLRPTGEIDMVNPLHVFLCVDGIHEMEERGFEYVRPILTDRTPRYVSVKDGKLWEIEFHGVQAEEGETHEVLRADQLVEDMIEKL